MSYLTYKESSSNQIVPNRTVEVINNQNLNNNRLNFIGYDQNGFPIYSGNIQYFSQTQQAINA